MSADHNAVINAEARRVLKPFGLTRKGTSRVWIDDHGWWTIQVEFQPSAWSKGSYLNVGVNWLLYEGSVGAFNVGSRVDVPFIEAAGNESFEKDAHNLALRAKAEVAQLRSRFSSLEAAASYYRSCVRQSAWDDYYCGVLMALSGDTENARAAFQSVPTHRLEYGWERALAQRASELHRLASDHTAFIETVRGIVMRTRSIGNLPDWESGLVFL
ncbi:hypothetical protein [Leptothrix ochracea]|uniref:hypothetical protein n=1 Tax=Leptothrix ochracea TaxID=735331 RepID=UPI0034E1F3D2